MVAHPLIVKVLNRVMILEKVAARRENQHEKWWVIRLESLRCRCLGNECSCQDTSNTIPNVWNGLFFRCPVRSLRSDVELGPS